MLSIPETTEIPVLHTGDREMQIVTRFNQFPVSKNPFSASLQFFLEILEKGEIFFRNLFHAFLEYIYSQKFFVAFEQTIFPYFLS